MTPRTTFKELMLLAVLTAGVLSACSTKKESSSAAAPKDDKKTTTSTGDATPAKTTSGASPCLTLDTATTGGTGGTTASATTASTTRTAGSTTGDAATASVDGGTGTTSDTTQPSISDCVTTPPATTAGGTTTGAATTLPGGNTDLTPGPGLEGCTAQGKIWVPPTDTAAAVCGDPLYEDVCCSDIANYYTALGTSTAATLKASIDKTASDRVAKGGPADMIWYGCSKSGGKYAIYGAKYVYDGDGTPHVWTESAYVTYTGAGGPNLTGQPATCKEVTAVDLGYRADATTTATSGTYDLTACGITESSHAGIKAWLMNQANYSGAGWTADGAVRLKTSNSPHGHHREFFNAALSASVNLATLPAAHPQNSCAVEQLLNDAGDTVIGYVFMGKVANGGPADSNWLFYALPSVAAGTETYGPASATCVGCHTKDAEFADFVRSRPVL